MDGKEGEAGGAGRKGGTEIYALSLFLIQGFINAIAYSLFSAVS